MMTRAAFARGLRGALGIGVIVLAAAPWLFDQVTLIFLAQFFCVLVLAFMWNLLAGYADIITLGQHGLVGVGGYAVYALTVLAGLDPCSAIALSGLVAPVIAFPTMLLAFKLRTVYLAIATWVVAEIPMRLTGKLPGLGQGSGATFPLAVAKSIGKSASDRFSAIYWLAFALALAALLTSYAILRSRIGLGLTAMRDNEEAAGAMGVNLRKARILCFLVTAPFLGAAGAIIALQNLRISPSASFSMNEWTVFVIFSVVIGGIGSLEGPIVGVFLYFLMRNFLSDLGAWHLIVLGALSITVMLVEPKGVWGLLRRALKFDIFPVVRVPSREFVQGVLSRTAARRREAAGQGEAG